MWSDEDDFECPWGCNCCNDDDSDDEELTALKHEYYENVDRVPHDPDPDVDHGEYDPSRRFYTGFMRNILDAALQDNLHNLRDLLKFDVWFPQVNLLKILWTNESIECLEYVHSIGFGVDKMQTPETQEYLMRQLITNPDMQLEWPYICYLNDACSTEATIDMAIIYERPDVLQYLLAIAWKVHKNNKPVLVALLSNVETACGHNKAITHFCEWL